MLLPVTAFLCARNGRLPKRKEDKIEMKRFIKYLICVLSQNYLPNLLYVSNTYLKKNSLIAYDAVSCNIFKEMSNESTGRIFGMQRNMEPER